MVAVVNHWVGGSATNATSTSLTVAGATLGNTLFATLVTSNVSMSSDPPAGWTTATNFGTRPYSRTWTRVATGDASDDISFTYNVTAIAQLIVYEYASVGEFLGLTASTSTSLVTLTSSPSRSGVGIVFATQYQESVTFANPLSEPEWEVVIPDITAGNSEFALYKQSFSSAGSVTASFSSPFGAQRLGVMLNFIETAASATPTLGTPTASIITANSVTPNVTVTF